MIYPNTNSSFIIGNPRGESHYMAKILPAVTLYLPDQPNWWVRFWIKVFFNITFKRLENG